jgi:RNA polymerase-binding transcription factor
MSAKRAAAKKRSSSSKKKVAKSGASRSAAGRSGSSSRRTQQKPSSKKTVKSAKSMSQNKVSKKDSSHKGHKKPSAKKTVAAAPVKTVAAAPVKKPAPAKPAATAVATAAAAKRRSSGSILSGPLRGFTPYQLKRGEDYMSKDQLEHFRQILLAWKRELMEEVDRTMLHMKDDAANFPDPNDRATQESEFGLELRTRDRERKLLKKIDSALSRIDDGSYGYCEETGDEIGLRRLEARPVATLCVEAQERRELAERQFRDREDQYR